MIVYLDLDRTLLKTDDLDQMWEYLAEVHPEAAGAASERESFFHHIDELYYYDMAAHLESVGLEATEVYDELRAAGFADGRFEHAGASELVQSLQELGYDVRILTFGADDYQQFKASLCPSALGLPLVVTRRPKFEVLEELEQECWLIDDKAIGDELPGNVSFLQVCHDPEMVPTTEVDWQVLRSLDQAREFFLAINEED